MIDRLIAVLAERQHGVVAVWQLLELGLGRGAIQYRVSMVACTASIAVFSPSATASSRRQGHRMAAVLAYGPDAAISHRIGGCALGDRSGLVQDRRNDARTAGAAAAIRAHRRAPPARPGHPRRLPVTSVARTILDLAAQLSKAP